jgi:serine/threonine protein kinase
VTELADTQDQIVCPSCESPADPRAVVCGVCGAVLASGIESDQATELLRKLRDALQGRYVLGTAIGLGRAGITVRGRRQSGSNRDVAIKVAWDDPVARRDLVREADLSAQVVHPNVLPMTRLDVAPPLVAVEMPLVEGGTLGDLIDSGTQVAYQRVVEIVRGIGKALDEAHERGIVHGALRPEKIHLDRDGNAIISGFMLGQFPSGDRDAPLPNSIGAPAYTAFEQRHNLQTIDGRADQFSLAVIVYELLCGRRTWRLPADGVLEIDAIEIVPHRAIAPAVPLSAGAAIKRATWKDPSYRYDNINDFIAGLTGTALEGTPSEQLARVDKSDIKRRSAVWILAPLAALIMLAAGIRPDVQKTAVRWWHVAFTDNTMFLPGGNYSGPSVDPRSPPTMPSPASNSSKRGDGSQAAQGNTRVGVESQREGPAAGPDRTFDPYPKGPLPAGESQIDSKRIDDPKSRGSLRVQEGPAKPGAARNGGSARVSIEGGAVGSPSRDKGATLAGDAAGSSAPGLGFVAVSANGGENVSVFVDGILRGKAPIVLRAMPGKHVVSVRGTGNLTFGSMSVTITARDTARAVFAPTARAPQE